MKSALITGCSSGIGLDCALTLARRGYQVFATIRKDEDKKKFENSKGIIPLILDVNDRQAVQTALGKVIEQTGQEGLQALVNNAGIVISGPLECLPLEAIKNQFETNVIAPLRMIQTFIPLIRQGGGRIINVGSISGIMAVPFVAPYCASKSAIKALSDCLRLELKPWKIPVTLIEPGPVRTPIWERSTATALELTSKMAPEKLKPYETYLNKLREVVEKTSKAGVDVSKVTNAIVHALESKRPRKRYLVGKEAKAEALMARYLPSGLLDKLVAKTMGLS